MTADIAQKPCEAEDEMRMWDRCLSQSYSGYSHVTVRKNNIQVKAGGKPIWTAPCVEIQYTGIRNKDYPFYVNGQNGKIVGAAPISKKKVCGAMRGPCGCA